MWMDGTDIHGRCTKAGSHGFLDKALRYPCRHLYIQAHQGSRIRKPWRCQKCHPASIYTSKVTMTMQSSMKS